MECVYCKEPLITALNGDVCLSCYEAELLQEERERKEALYNLKHDLANNLQLLKKFDVGYSSKYLFYVLKKHYIH